eukprot:c24182_g3_i1 orf=415-1491(+)
MLGCISCRWLTESHVVAGPRVNWHADDLVLLVDKRGRGRSALIFGATGTLELNALRFATTFSSQHCCRRRRLKSWKLEKPKHWVRSIFTSTASSGQGKAKYLQCTQKAGGDQTAMEASHSCSAEHLETEIPLSLDAANSNSIPGIIYPSATTVGKSTNIVWQECMVRKEERHKLLRQKGCLVWITGLSGSGKSTLACTLDHALINRGKLSYVLDGDNVRHGLNKNLGFTAEDRAENIRRVGEVARLFVDAGVICIASVISPYRKDRDACRKLLSPEEFIEVYMNFPLSLCEQRDPKGLYKLARVGKIKGFTGVDDPYEAPLNCEIVMEPIDGRCPTPAEMAAQLISLLEMKGFLEPPP